MKEQLSYTVKTENDGLPVKKILSACLGLSRREITRLNSSGGILLNNETCRLSETVHTEDIIMVVFGEAEKAHAQRILKQPDILLEDDDLVIVNKPAGMPVHASREHSSDDMGTLLKEYLQLDQNLKPIGRLDKNVSGIMVYAKTKAAAGRLSEEREKGQLKKTYLAIIEGSFEEKSGTLKYRLERDAIHHNRQSSETGQLCITDYEVIEEYSECSLIQVVIRTGRTHQIRAGMASFGHPLYGDHLYGGSTEGMHRPALHCADLCFIHPRTKEEVHIVCEMPMDMKRLLEGENDR